LFESVPAQQQPVDKCTKIWYIVDMKISLNKVEYECRRRDLSVGGLLRESGVSRNAFYSLARKEYVVPLSLIRIADRLNVPVSDLLEETDTPAARMKAIAAEAALLVDRYPEVDPDNVRHTLILLNEEPVERLRRALRRGRFVDIR
jgi:hypothetical protein